MSFITDLRTGDLGPSPELPLGNPLVGERNESAKPVDRSLTDGSTVGDGG